MKHVYDIPKGVNMLEWLTSIIPIKDGIKVLDVEYFVAAGDGSHFTSELLWHEGVTAVIDPSSSLFKLDGDLFHRYRVAIEGHRRIIAAILCVQVLSPTELMLK